MRQPLRDFTLLTAALAAGWFAHPRPVHAADSAKTASGSSADSTSILQYQFATIGKDPALTFYDPDQHIVSVYLAPATGSSSIACAYQYHLTRTGAALDRKNCQPGSLLSDK